MTMTVHSRIELGDRVKVVFVQEATAGFWGTVVYAPRFDNDCWIIDDGRGIVDVRNCSYVYKPHNDDELYQD